MPIAKEIVYPFFLECLQFAEDNFWENIFEDLAYGITPYGTYINKDFLLCGYKGKEFSYKIQRKNEKELYSDIYNLFKNKLGILSYKDNRKKILEFQKVEKHLKISYDKWSEIRKQNIKDYLIEKYVLKQRLEHSLSLKQSKFLVALISIALLFKIITAKDIIYQSGEIKQIKGIHIENRKIILQTHIHSIKDTVKYSPLYTTKKDPGECWEKYLKDIELK